MMRLVADESCDFAVVSAVRSAGHDVISIAERMPGAEDEQVIKLAATERRLLLTEVVAEAAVDLQLPRAEAENCLVAVNAGR